MVFGSAAEEGDASNKPKALHLFNLAAQQGHVPSLMQLADMHSRGVAVARSCNHAARLYKEVAEVGGSGAMEMRRAQVRRHGRVYCYYIPIQCTGSNMFSLRCHLLAETY
jgi:TPR repeat protein